MVRRPAYHGWEACLPWLGDLFTTHESPAYHRWKTFFPEKWDKKSQKMILVQVTLPARPSDNKGRRLICKQAAGVPDRLPSGTTDRNTGGY